MLNTILSALCFLLILCVIVIVHEGGHALVARLTGMRVTEFYIGMPYGPEKSFVSRRSGIRYGATLALLGGYTRICGMAFAKDDRLALALALVNARGRLTTDELVRVLGCEDVAEAQAIVDALVDIGSVEPVYKGGRRRSRKEKPVAYATVARDAQGLTVRDRGNSLAAGVAHEAGSPFDPGMSPDDFLAQELAHTYAGKSFTRRALVLVAGVAFNLLFAFVVLTGCYMTMYEQHLALGVSDVAAGSPAAEAGMAQGDEIRAVNGTPIAELDSVQAVSDLLASGDELTVDYVAADGGGDSAGSSSPDADAVVKRANLTRDDDGKLGLSLQVFLENSDTHLGLADSMRASVGYIGSVATAVIGLLNPSEAPQVISQSSGVVGIAQMTSQAVSTGLFDIVVLLAALSVSLGWMNLLPIPPLDGGKLVIEIVERVLGREVPLWIQGLISFLGIAAVLALFFFMVFQDVSRLL